MFSVSEGEKKYIQEGLECNTRNDGRERYDFRSFKISCGVVEQANGSARLEGSGLDILVAVTALIGTPKEDKRDCGVVEVNFRCATTSTDRNTDDSSRSINEEYARFLETSISQEGVLDLKSLCIVPGKSCWVVHVDVIVLQHNGNILDFASFAVKAALIDTDIFSVNVTMVDGGMYEGEGYDLDIDDSLENAKHLVQGNVKEANSRIPCCISLFSIKDIFFADASLEESACVTNTLSLAVLESGDILSIRKTGRFPPSVSELKKLFNKSKDVFHTVEQLIIEELERETKNKR